MMIIPSISIQGFILAFLRFDTSLKTSNKFGKLVIDGYSHIYSLLEFEVSKGGVQSPSPEFVCTAIPPSIVTQSMTDK